MWLRSRESAGRDWQINCLVEVWWRCTEEEEEEEESACTIFKGCKRLSRSDGRLLYASLRLPPPPRFTNPCRLTRKKRAIMAALARGAIFLLVSLRYLARLLSE